MKYYILLLCICIQYIAGAQSPAITIGDSLYAMGNYAQAIQQYERIKNKDAKTLFKLARGYKGKGLKSKAITYYKKSLEKDKNQSIAQTEYGRLLLSSARFSVADTVFRDLIKKHPNNPEYYYLLGKTIKAIKAKDTFSFDIRIKVKGEERIETAEEAFAKAIQLDSTHQKAVFELSKIYLGKNEYPIVEKITKVALEAEPENVEILGVLAQNYFHRGWWEEAIDMFSKLVDLGKGNAFIHNRLGRSYYKKRIYDKAIEQYEILLNFDDEDWGTHLILAKLYNYGIDEEKALDHAKKALYFKDLPLDDVYFTTSRIYEAKKQFPESMKVLQKAIKENPENLEAHYAIAIAADNYYEDKEAVLKKYEIAAEKYRKGKKSPYLIKLIENRITDLKREIFMDVEKE